MAEPKPVQKQSWWHLLFLHWELAPAALQAMLPPGLTLDTYEGRAFVGLVPFTMTGVRPVWSPELPFLSNFHETNLRTYVRRGKDAGVWFFSLEAANALAVAGARALFSLPYYFATMKLDLDERERGAAPVITYSSARKLHGTRPATLSLRYQPTGTPSPATPGTLEHFLVERYTLFTWRFGKLRLARVRHKPYQIQGARVDALDESLLQAAGLTRPQVAPLAHYAQSVDVDVFGLETPAG